MYNWTENPVCPGRAKISLPVRQRRGGSGIFPGVLSGKMPSGYAAGRGGCA